MQTMHSASVVHANWSCIHITDEMVVTKTHYTEHLGDKLAAGRHRPAHHGNNAVDDANLEEARDQCDVTAACPNQHRNLRGILGDLLQHQTVFVALGGANATRQ